jgi:S1-C subfamily serine protease
MILNKITQLSIGGIVSSIVALSLLPISNYNTKVAAVQLVQALSPEEVNLRAKQTIVRVDGAGVGSGTLIDYSNNTYTILTNWHVVKAPGNYVVQTIDGRKHQIESTTIKQLPGLDLAVLQFDSSQNYQTVEFGDSSNLSEGQNVYFAGYPGELRQEDNRYYRFFTANLVGILPKSTEKGYSLIYNGEAFPGMSGSPVFNSKGLMIGIHGEANIHAMSGAISNYAIPINSYRQAIAQLPAEPTPDPSPAAQDASLQKSPTPEVATSPAQEQTPEVIVDEPSDNIQDPESTELLNSDNISSVPTFTSDTTQESKPETAESDNTQNSEPEADEIDTPQASIETVTELAATQEPKPEAATKPEVNEQESSKVAIETPEESEEIDIPTVTRKIPLVSKKTDIDYTKLRNLLRDEKWSEADLHTYELLEQIFKTAKLQNKHVFIELKTIAEFSCSDIRTVDYLWKKYSDDKFGFSPQQDVWQSVNQEGDFSTQTWRRFATKVGWKQGEVESSSGYKLYDQLSFEPNKAPAGHLPWWFALSDEEQNVIKYLFARCNLNPTVEELEAEARGNDGESSADNRNEANPRDRVNSNKTPES